MGYTLRSHISTGRIDTPDYGSFEIRDSEVEVEDYDTAATLVNRYTVEWPDGDPREEEEAEAEDEDEAEAEDDADAEAEDDADAEDEDEEFDAAEFVDRTPMSEVTDDLESGDYDAHLDAIESEASRRGVLDAISARREDREE